MMRKKFVSIFIVFAILTVGIGAFLFVSGASTTKAIANLVIKKDGEVYVFSKLGTFLVENSLAKEESPATFGFIQVFQDEGLFVAPKDVKEIANILSGNYKVHTYAEKSYQGYITSGEQEIYDHKMTNESTMNIGEQVQVNTVTLQNPNNNEQYSIQWQNNPNQGVKKALQNCELKSFWTQQVIQPGETTVTSNEFIVVNLKDIVAFYQNSFKLELDVKDQLLYFNQE